MESGENLNTDINNDNPDFETANGWESLMDDESAVAAFAARALQRAIARDRIEQDQKHAEPETPYRQQRKKIEQKLGHVGTSILDVRDKTTDRQAIRQELRDYGVDSIDELDDTEYSHERILSPERVFKKFSGLFAFLGEDTKGNPNVIEEYQQITDKKEQLRFILSSSLSDKVRLFCSENFDYPNYDNFMHRLQFQQDFINGTAKVWTQKWDGHKGEYIDVQRTLDSSDANRDDILLGLNRASLKSAMIGTPEYGAYKMAMDIMRDRDWRMTPDFPKISGYRSSIGSWETIIDEYDAIASKVARRNPDMDEESLEYITVRKAAKIFVDSMEYNDTSRGPESPYVSSFHESVAWAQLGQLVRAQLKGMRQKIEGVDLHNIGRFLGRSGLNTVRRSYSLERKRLVDEQGKFVHYKQYYPDSGEARDAVKEANERELQKQNQWQEKETERINHKYDKLISKTRSEERIAEYNRRRQSEHESLSADCNERSEYFKHRTLDQLCSDIESRINVIDKRINKRKSIAEKAIELHFKLGNGREEWDDDLEEYVRIGGSQYQECLDWINDAPFGVIKRAHRRMVDGMPADEIYKLAIGETIRKAVNNPDQADIAMHQLFRDVEDGTTYKIRGIIRLAEKLSKYSKELSYSELESMSDKDTRWIEDSLAAFPFSDVKQFIDKGLNLSLIPKLSRISEEFGYELDTNRLMELSGKGVINSYTRNEVEEVFTSTLRNFSLDEAMTAMDANVDLRILNAAKSILSAQGISDFSEILDRAIKIGQFSDGYEGGYKELISQYHAAINSIGIEKADSLLSRGVDLGTFNMTTREFRESVGDDFDKALRLSEKISVAMQRSRDLAQEETSIRILYNSDAGHTESQIISLYEHGITASTYKDVFDTRKKSGLSFDDEVKLLQNALKDNPGSWRIKEAIESFDDNMLHQLAESGANVIHASRVKYLLGRDEKYSEFNTPENVLYLASNNLDVDAFLRAADAGFSLNEINLYPFLASDLLIKERNE